MRCWLSVRRGEISIQPEYDPTAKVPLYNKLKRLERVVTRKMVSVPRKAFEVPLSGTLNNAHEESNNDQSESHDFALLHPLHFHYREFFRNLDLRGSPIFGLDINNKRAFEKVLALISKLGITPESNAEAAFEFGCPKVYRLCVDFGYDSNCQIGCTHAGIDHRQNKRQNTHASIYANTIISPERKLTEMLREHNNICECIVVCFQVPAGSSRNDITAFKYLIESCIFDFANQSQPTLLTNFLKHDSKKASMAITKFNLNPVQSWLIGYTFMSFFFPDVYNCEVDCSTCHPICSYCEERFEDRLTYVEHIKAHENPLNECHVCGEKFYTNMGFQQHLKKHEKENELMENTICGICGKQFQNLGALISHSSGHTELERSSFACPICGRKQSRASVLRDHMKKYHNTNLVPQIRGYKHPGYVDCPTCGKTCVGKAGMLQHQRAGMLQHGRPCQLCGKVLFKVADVRKHHLEAHVKQNGRAFTCMQNGCGNVLRQIAVDRVKVPMHREE